MYQQLQNDNIIKPVKNVCELFKIIYRDALMIWNEVKDNKAFQKMFMRYLKNIE